MDTLRLKFPHTLSTGYQNPISIIMSVLVGTCTNGVAVYVYVGYSQNYIFSNLYTLNYNQYCNIYDTSQ